MTEAAFEPVQTQEWFNELKPSVKDMVCNLYEYIVRRSKVEDYINFTKEGIFFAHAKTSITVVASEKFVDRFYYNLDKIKVLVDARPVTKHVYWSEEVIKGVLTETPICIFKHMTFKFYCPNKLRDKVYHEYTDWSGSSSYKFKNHKTI